MYDLNAPNKPRTRYFVATTSDGQFHATRSSLSRVYSHATIARSVHWSGESTAYWHSRKELGERQLRATKKYDTPYELVETREVNSREFRRVKKELLQTKQPVTE
jgi:hypothetical protein